MQESNLPTSTLQQNHHLMGPPPINFVAAIVLFALAIFTFAVFGAYVTLESMEGDSSPLGSSESISLQPTLRHRPEVSPNGGMEVSSLPKLSNSTIATVEAMRLPHEIETMDETLPYNTHKCPPEIPDGYPRQWSIIEVLSHWNPDDMDIPDKIYQGFCEIDWSNAEEREIAEKYREAEMPFVVRNHPTIWETAERWSDSSYLSRRLKNRKARNEHAVGNQMPYWKQPKVKGKFKDFVPPTDNVELTFDEWFEKSLEVETLEDPIHTEHYYFRLNADYRKEQKNAWVFKDLPFFYPKKNFFMVEPDDYRGVNCRLGAKGIIAHAHYDFSRNFILLLKGQKRYILAHPNQCSNLELYPQGHPSARHSSVNWSNETEWQQGNFPRAHVNEVIMQAGDIMYLPTAWFHFIVSLNMNYQCNARSGITKENYQTIEDCGFL